VEPLEACVGRAVPPLGGRAMSLSAPFIRRRIGTTLLTVALALAGGIAFLLLPVAPLPQVEFPTIQVSAGLPGASPETMASAVATPLERQFGRIAGVTEMTSTSSLGSTSIVLQFDLNRNIDAAARDVQAAINAARGNLPANLPNNPWYRKVNPGRRARSCSCRSPRTCSTARGCTTSRRRSSSRRSRRSKASVRSSSAGEPCRRSASRPTPRRLNARGMALEDLRGFLTTVNVNRPKGEIGWGDRAWSLWTNDQMRRAPEYGPLVVSYKSGAAVRLSDVARVEDSVEDTRTAGNANRKPAVIVVIFRQPGANIIETVDRIMALLPRLQADIPPTMKLETPQDRTTTIRASVREVDGP
jgi:multidrug efflux pump